MTTKITDDELERIVEAWESCGRNTMATARTLNFTRSKMEHWIHAARVRGFLMADVPDEQDDPAPVAAVSLEALRKLLRAGRHGLDGISEALKTSRGQALDGIDALRASGYSVQDGAGRYWLDTSPQTAADSGGEAPVYTSRADNSYTFGFTSDNHLGSKYSRLDVLDKLFERFVAVGVDRVFHAGNWIEGEGHDNRHDLTHHGMHQQCSYLAERWPRAGLVTYAVSGNDHEGWYAKREGIHIGRYAEQCFKDIGRVDWVDIGYMECDVALTNANTGVRARLRVAHPGGGSAYAHSYAPQKYMESLSSGEKPAAVLLGHWHKLSCNNIRGTWVIQTGCTQDQTPWARQKKLDYHVGGGICRLVQDPDTGALTSCTVELIQFFNQTYYGAGRWSPHGNIRPARREIENL